MQAEKSKKPRPAETGGCAPGGCAREVSSVLPRAGGLDENTGTFVREGSGLGLVVVPRGI